MQSSSARLYSGAVVTLLLLALVALIAFTLMRSDSGAQSEGSQSGETPVVVDQAAVENTPEPVGNEQAGGAPPSSIEQAAPSEGITTTVAPEPIAAVVATDVMTDAPAPGIALTIQPTPTRRIEESAAVTDTVPGIPALPAVDLASAPSEPLLAYANPDYVHDVAIADDALWTATSAGAQQWVLADGDVQHFGYDSGLASPRLRNVVECPIEGIGLVFGGDAGLEIHDSASGEWAHLGVASRANEGLPFAEISALACNVEASLLAVGSPAGEIALYDAVSAEWSEVAAEDDESLTEVHALAIDDAGLVWAAMGATLAQIEDGEIVERFDADNSPLTGETITDVAVDAEGTLWATAGERLFHYAEQEWEVVRGVTNGGDYPEGALVAVEPTSGGRVWIASQSGEICRFDPELGACAPWYAGLEGMADSPMTSLALGVNGEIAFGTAGGGSSVTTGQGWRAFSETIAFPASNRIFALASDTNGYLWVASGSGVQQTNPAMPQEARQFSADEGGPSATNVRALFADSSGGIWLGGIGASYFDGVNWTNYAQGDGLSVEAISSIAQDSQGRIWFGTSAGLSIWTGSTFFNLTAENGLPDAEILSLASDANSVWIGSANGGLYRFENNQLQVLTKENVGLPSNRILSLMVAPDRSLYVGTDAGLARFARGEFAPVVGVPEVAITALAQAPDGSLWAAPASAGTWTQPAGVQPTRAWTEAESDGGALPAAARALTVDLFGGVWIGTENAGLVRFAPEQ